MDTLDYRTAEGKKLRLGKPSASKGRDIMKMLRAVLYLVLVILPLGRLSLCRAQGPGGGPPMQSQQSPEKELKHLEKVLSLTAEQKSAILPLLKERSTSMQTIMEDQDTPMRDKMERMVKIRNSANQQIRELLTESQRISFDKMLADDEKHRPRPGDGPMGDPPEGGPPPQAL